MDANGTEMDRVPDTAPAAGRGLSRPCCAPVNRIFTATRKRTR